MTGDGIGGITLQTLLLLLGGLLAGSMGGLLGIGGGIVLMPLLRFVVGLPPAYAAGTCIAAVFFTTLGGGYRHIKLGHVRLRSITPIIIAGAAAAAVFSLGFSWLARQDRWLDFGIGAVFSFISVRMIVEGLSGLRRASAPAEAPDPEVRGSAAQKIGLGLAGGVLPGLLGVGTGGLLVPALNFLIHVPVKTAMAASLVCFCFNALVSSGIKLAQGFVTLAIAGPLCLGTLVGANLGAMLNRRFSSGLLKLTFGLVFLYVSVKFLASSYGVRI